jgi:hypothetical protein
MSDIGGYDYEIVHDWIMEGETTTRPQDYLRADGMAAT